MDQDKTDRPPVLTVTGRIARIHMHRPARHNLLEPEDLATLMRHFAAAGADPRVRVLILSASAPTFSSGFNIGRLGDGFDHHEADPFEAVCDAMEAVPCLTIAAMAGPVYGGAADLALACDFRIGVTGMTLRIPAARIGNHYYGGGLRRFATRLGQTAAARVFLAAATLDDAELLRCGYLSELVPPETLEARVAELSETLVAAAPLAVDGMKAVLNGAVRGAFDPHLARENHARSMRSRDLQEGRRAFAEKRAPEFQGK